VLVLDNHVLATGYNGAPSGFPHCDKVGCTLDSDGHCIVVVHAEENAIFQCALHGVSTKGATCYVTHSPCPRCVSRLKQAGITTIFYNQEFYNLDIARRFAKAMHIQLSRLKIGH
jgi:dCMP deaminase